MNPFQSIPDNVRRRLYLTYGVAGLTLGSVTAYTTAVGTDTPRWVGGASAVLVVISILVVKAVPVSRSSGSFDLSR